MIVHNKIFNLSSLLLLFILNLPIVQAAEVELCEPFKDSQIDQSLIAVMLEAAKRDHLYQIKPTSSQMGFCVKSKIGIVKGNFEKFNGGIALKGKESQSLVSIDAGSLKSNAFFIDKILKSKGFFNVKDYPNLIFVSTGFEWLSENKAIVKGTLKMHGVTKPVAFYMEITELDADLGDVDTIMVKATTTIQRSAFGMDKLPLMVNDRVSLCMTIEAERYRSSSSQPVL